MTTLTENKKKKSALIPIEKLHEFDGHPYKVQDNEEMQNLVESIKTQEQRPIHVKTVDILMKKKLQNCQVRVHLLRLAMKHHWLQQS